MLIAFARMEFSVLFHKIFPTQKFLFFHGKIHLILPSENNIKYFNLAEFSCTCFSSSGL